VISAQEAPDPPSILYRVARGPDPLRWPDTSTVGAHRFDDPVRPSRFRTLYVSSSRLACFLETLAWIRHQPASVVAWRAVAGPDGPLPPEEVPTDWQQQRLVGKIRVVTRARLLDIRTLPTCAFLRRELVTTLHTLNVPDLDPSTVRGLNRALTQAIAGWAFEQGYQGVAYRSRFDDGLTYTFDCWALFDIVDIEQAGPHGVIARDDPDLHDAAALHGLRLSAVDAFAIMGPRRIP